MKQIPPSDVLTNKIMKKKESPSKTSVNKIIRLIIFVNKKQKKGMYQKSDIKWKLQIIFVYYTSYADRNNYRLLKKQNYRRFLFDSQTTTQQSCLVYFDIAFQKINKSGIIFKDFLKLIPEIAQLVFKKYTRSQAFNQYIHKHISPLYISLIQLSQFGQQIFSALNTQPQPQIQKKLMKIPITERAFNQYIASSIHGKQENLIFQNFIYFLKDFQICPQLISKSLIYLIFLYNIKQSNPNKLFSIDNFVKILIIISQISSKKISNTELNSNDKIIKLLQRMQISIGFDKVGKKILFETAICPSFLKSYCDYKQDDHSIDKSNKCNQKINPLSTRHKNYNDHLQYQQYFCNSNQKFIKKQQMKLQNLSNITNILSEIQHKNYSKELKEIKLVFEELCEFGQVANSKTLKSFKIKKLFQRIGIIPIVGQPWLDIQIVNLKKNSQSGKIQLTQFLQLLSLTTKKISITFQQLLNLILTDQHTHHTINKDQLNPPHKQYTQQQQHTLKQIIQCCQKSLQRVFKKYSQDQLTISFSSLTKMMYQFEIFPIIVSKNKLYQIFSTLNDIRQQTISTSRKLPKVKQVQNYLKDTKQMDFSGYLMCLIYISQQIYDQNLETSQKLIVLLQKINQSQGYKKLFIINLVSELRKKFTKLYVRNLQHLEEKNQNFDQLLNHFV